MKNIKVLDVTLRDGGCVNDFNFGQTYMEKILDAQEKSRIEIIELGYLDQNRGSKFGRTQYVNERVICDCILKKKKNNISYVAMMDYGKYDVDNLLPRTKNGIDGIRLAFHKKDCKAAIRLGRKIIDKGYDFYIQPMLTLRYSDAELIDLIHDVNNELPDTTAFYIVDSFGEMRGKDVTRVVNLVDHNLNEDIEMGFHSHNNLQLSYSNAMALLHFSTERDIILDSSIMGMGKGAGNLNTELLLEHLNLYYEKKYNIAPLLDVIDTVINQIHNEFYWGYAVEYYLSSTNHCTPSYASYYFNKHMLPVARIGELLGQIEEEKKLSFDRQYAEELYIKFNENEIVDDDIFIQEFKERLKDKVVLLIAPGKSILRAKEKIDNYLQDKNVISIGLNTIIDEKMDYIFTTRSEVYDEAFKLNEEIICPSNLKKEYDNNVRIVDYSKWIDVDSEGKINDSSFTIISNILIKIGVKKVLLAGFDGFSLNINDNYFRPDLRRTIDIKSLKEKNRYQKRVVEKMRHSKIDICFITESIYE